MNQLSIDVEEPSLVISKGHEHLILHVFWFQVLREALSQEN